MTQEKVRAAQELPQAVDVVVTRIKLFLSLTLLLVSQSLIAAVLPEDRADILYHSYDGGGAEISGPSLLVRKKFSEHVSASFNHYVDNVSSASIDVITTASPYTENRVEHSMGVDYLHEKSTMSLGFSQSDESDFNAKTMSLNFSQEMFGDLTTVSMGYAKGNNIVGQNNDPLFSKKASTQNYRLSMSQVMTKDLILSFAFEAITDEGFLNNPYRTVRFVDNSVPRGYSYQAEVYPNTRTSTALAVRGRYYLQHRAVLHAGYRLFSDSWGINANTYEMGYTMPYDSAWIFDFNYRFYDQDKADFYSDLFPFVDAQNFLARDKELSSFSTSSVGLGVTYQFAKNGTGFIKKGEISFNLDVIQLDYDDFRNLTVNSAVGEEPLYDQSANVIRFFASIWF